MNSIKSRAPILMADDDADDRLLVKEAFEENNLVNTIRFVEDGEQLLDYLHNRGQFINADSATPGLILLDLNMPKIDGRAALQHIKSHPALKRIPIIILTTSSSDEDMHQAYNLGANSFISKPTKFSDLLEVTRKIGAYWFETVSLPKS